MVGAVIYVRVSTKEQTENLSLPTQLRACEEYCRRQGYEILERFHEEGESAKTTDRSQLQALLKYCRTHKGKVHFVVVYNLTRFAREKYDHFALRAHLKSLGISLRSATEPIDDTSTGKLMEGVLAAFAQFDNDVRSERTLAGMKAALALGRWTFPAPLGYLNAPKWSNSSLVHDPERGPLVKAGVRGSRDADSSRRRKSSARRRTPACGPKGPAALAADASATCCGTGSTSARSRARTAACQRGATSSRSIDEATFYRAQAVLDGRVPWPRRVSATTRTFRCGASCAARSCGRPLTGSWSKGRNGRYAYYHCPRRCRAVNVSKAELEGAFVDELALLQPTPGYMRLVKDRILYVWEQRVRRGQRPDAPSRSGGVKADPPEARPAGRGVPATRSRSTCDTYGRQRDRLREELTLSKIDHHTEAVDELDVEGILAFAERILPRASDLWVQASLDYKQRLQQLFFPEGIAFDGNRFNRTAVTAPLFKYLAPGERGRRKCGVPNGIRTRVLALKGPRPGPLDDGDSGVESSILPRACR